MKNLQSILYYFSGALAIGSLALAGIRIILKSRNEIERTKAMESLLYIMIGTIILSAAMAITGFIVGSRESLVSSLTNSGSGFTPPAELSKAQDDTGNFFVRALTLPITILNTLCETILKSISDFKPINDLIFNINNNSPYAPFTASEFKNLNKVYKLVSSLTTGLIFIMVIKTGVQYIINSGSALKRMELKQEISRWFFSIYAMVFAPVFIEGLIFFMNELTGYLYQIVKPMLASGGLADTNFVAGISTGNVLTTAIIKFLFLYVELNINITFLARKIIIVVLYGFTPIVAILWGINKRVAAAQIWIGEMLTNIAMQFCYAFPMFIMLTTNLASTKNWFFTLLWMFALISIAEMLRNSLQGLFVRLAGVDEAGIGKQAMTSVGRMFGGTKMAFTESTKGMSYDKVKGEMYGGVRPYAFDGNTNDNKWAASASGSSGPGFTPTPSGGGGSGATFSPNNGMSGLGTDSSNRSTSNNNISNTPFVNNNSVGSAKIPLDMYQFASGEDNPQNFDIANGIQGMAQNIEGNYEKLSKDNPEFTKETLSGWASQDKYNSMLYNNLNQEHSKRIDYGKAVGGFANKMIGHDPGFTMVANGIGGFAGRIQRSTQAANAIKTTVEQMKVDYKNETGKELSNKEATDKLFGNQSIGNQNFNKIRFIDEFGKKGSEGANKILMQNHPYSKANGFVWKQ